MQFSEFTIGGLFMMSGNRWRCTDKGTRVITAIKLSVDKDLSWYEGPPYAVAELVIDEYDQPACSPLA